MVANSLGAMSTQHPVPHHRAPTTGDESTVDAFQLLQSFEFEHMVLSHDGQEVLGSGVPVVTGTDIPAPAAAPAAAPTVAPPVATVVPVATVASVAPPLLPVDIDAIDAEDAEDRAEVEAEQVVRDRVANPLTGEPIQHSVRFENGDVYSGEWLNGYPHGKGTYTWNDITTDDPCGGFTKRVVLKSGVVLPQLSVHFDHFIDDHGAFSPVVFEGEFVYGVPNGAGKCQVTFEDTFTFTCFQEGTWKDGRLHGKGVVQEHDRLDGKFDQGCIQYGITSANGELDTFSYRNGDKFYGQFVNGKRHGQQCQLYSANGDMFSGDFKDGKRDGRGRLTLADGETVEGLWRDDVLLSDTSAYDKARRDYEKAVRAMEAVKKANTECQVIRSSGGVYQSTTARLSTSGVVDIPYEIKGYSESEARRTFVSFPLEACDENPDTWLPVWGKFTQVKATRDDPKVWFVLLSSGNRMPLPYTYLQRFISPQLLESCIEKAPSPVDITEAVLAPITAPINAPAPAPTAKATTKATIKTDADPTKDPDYAGKMDRLFAKCYELGEYKPSGKVKGISPQVMHAQMKEVGRDRATYPLYDLPNATQIGKKLEEWLRSAFQEQFHQGEVEKVNMSGSVGFKGFKPL